MTTHEPDRPGTSAPRLVVGAAIIDPQRRLLAARRTEPSRLAGGWELPGGKVEPDEEPVDALHREIHEELGVRIELLDPLPGPFLAAGPFVPGFSLTGPQSPHLLPTWPLVAGTTNPDSTTTALTMLVWTARLVDGEPEPQPLEDHDQLRWLDREHVWDVAWLPADRPIVAALEVVLHGIRD